MDLLPPIAAGRLEAHSLAELVASAFAAYATGTLVLERGRSEERLFLRYGIPCGVQRASPGMDFAAWLGAEGLPQPNGEERRLLETEFHSRQVFELGLLREGAYELRGWERPPAWTETLQLDPLRLLLEAFGADEMFARRDALLSAVSGRRLRQSSELASLLSRLALQPEHSRFLSLFDSPRGLEACARMSGEQESAESFVCAALLLGLLEIEENEQPEALPFLRPLDPAPSSTAFDPDAIELDLDIEDPFFLEPPLPPEPLESLPSSSAQALAGIDEMLQQIVRDSTPAPGFSQATSDLFDDLDLEGAIDPEEMTGPISIASEPTPLSGDELALAAASESFEADEGLFSSDDISSPITVGDDDLSLVMAAESAAEESGLSGMQARLREHTLTPGPDRAGVRQRLLARAFRNVGGDAFRREPRTPSGGVPITSEFTLPPLQSQDTEFERELRRRLEQRTADHFTRLGVERTADTGQVKAAFLEAAKRFHPDRVSASQQQHLLPLVREVFALVKDSYDALIDPAARARYAAELAAKSSGESTGRDPEKAKAAFQLAQRSLRRQDLAQAEAELVRAVALDPTAEHLAELAWTLYSNVKRRDEAAAEIRELVKKALLAKPDHDRAYTVAAYIARVDGQHEQSETLFRKALKRNPRNVDAAREISLIDKRRSAQEKKGGLFDRLRKK